MNETWLPIFGYDFYEVSNFGRVRSIPRIDRRGQARPGCILKPSLNGAGYPFINLHRNGKQSPVTIHRLVATAFLGPKPEKLNINHKDANKLNNAALNLEYITASENRYHAYKLGLVHPPHYVGSNHPRAILKEDQVRCILASTEPARILAERYGVNRSTIEGVRYRNNWKHISA